jgi:hypothetical protein
MVYIRALDATCRGCADENPGTIAGIDAPILAEPAGNRLRQGGIRET